MKIAFIATVLNEEKNIELLLNSLLKQKKRPDEVIIVDGGSKDNTVKIIKDWILKIRSEEFKKKIKLIIKTGNRSVGRNEAIKKATSEIIVSSDAGCILDKNWIKNIVQPFKNADIDVVAGFYRGIPQSIFEKSLIPYILVMPDKVRSESFLPSARSMAFRKHIWNKVGGFPLLSSNNEDFVFARKLRRFGAKIAFKKNAIVYYMPDKNVINVFLMFLKFAKGDAESGIFRPKAALIFVRYGILIWLLIYAYFFKLFFILEIILYILILYIVWAIWKNYRYVKDREAILFLPLIQLISDVAIIYGSTVGFVEGIWDIKKKL